MIAVASRNAVAPRHPTPRYITMPSGTAASMRRSSSGSMASLRGWWLFFSKAGLRLEGLLFAGVFGAEMRETADHDWAPDLEMRWGCSPSRRLLRRGPDGTCPVHGGPLFAIRVRSHNERRRRSGGADRTAQTMPGRGGAACQLGPPRPCSCRLSPRERAFFRGAKGDFYPVTALPVP